MTYKLETCFDLGHREVYTIAYLELSGSSTTQLLLLNCGADPQLVPNLTLIPDINQNYLHSWQAQWNIKLL